MNFYSIWRTSQPIKDKNILKTLKIIIVERMNHIYFTIDDALLKSITPFLN